MTIVFQPTPTNLKVSLASLEPGDLFYFDQPLSQESLLLKIDGTHYLHLQSYRIFDSNAVKNFLVFKVKGVITIQFEV